MDLFGGLLRNLSGFDSDEFVNEPTDVRKVLSIYEPDLGPSLRHVVGFKLYGLRALAMIFSSKNNFLHINSVIIQELTYIDLRLPRQGLFAWNISSEQLAGNLQTYEARGYIRFKKLHLSDRTERDAYITKANDRLSELESGKNRLAELLRKHFEPHHLI